MYIPRYSDLIIAILFRDARAAARSSPPCTRATLMAHRALPCAVCVALVRGAGSSQSWSNITLATCDESDPAQICTIRDSSHLSPVRRPSASRRSRSRHARSLTRRCSRRSFCRRDEAGGQLYWAVPHDLGMYRHRKRCYNGRHLRRRLRQRESRGAGVGRPHVRAADQEPHFQGGPLHRCLHVA
jgi:hypothetical protein